MNDSPETADNQKGEIEFSVQMGVVSVTVFRKIRVGQWGEFVTRTVTIRRRYTDDKGKTQWAAGSLRPEHLPVASLLLSQIAERLVSVRNGQASRSTKPVETNGANADPDNSVPIGQEFGDSDDDRF